MPLAFVLLGVSGAWISNLTALEPYKPYFIAVTLGFLGLGFWQVFFRAKPECEEGSFCAKSQSTVATQIALWTGTGVVVLAATVDLWAPLLY